MVVAPFSVQRRAWVGTVWLAGVRSIGDVDAVVKWVRAGGPGDVPIRDRLESLVTPALRRTPR